MIFTNVSHLFFMFHFPFRPLFPRCYLNRPNKRTSNFPQFFWFTMLKMILNFVAYGCPVYLPVFMAFVFFYYRNNLLFIFGKTVQICKVYLDQVRKDICMINQLIIFLDFDSEFHLNAKYGIFIISLFGIFIRYTLRIHLPLNITNISFMI